MSNHRQRERDLHSYFPKNITQTRKKDKQRKLIHHPTMRTSALDMRSRENKLEGSPWQHSSMSRTRAQLHCMDGTASHITHWNIIQTPSYCCKKHLLFAEDASWTSLMCCTKLESLWQHALRLKVGLFRRTLCKEVLSCWSFMMGFIPKL